MTMTREEQIWDEACHRYADSKMRNAFVAAAKWADQHPNWIPVEERLPEENTTPLVRMDLSDKFNEETIIYDVVVFDQNGFHTPYKVTHWMEIQPPRKEEE